MNTPMMVGELVAEYFVWLDKEVAAGRLAEKTATYYRTQLGHFKLSLGQDRLIASLIPYDLESDKRSWHYIQAVQRLFAWATANELVAKHPFKRVKLPRVRGRRRVLARAELLRLLRRSVRPLRDLLTAQHLSIARPQEVRALRWQDYRPELRAFLLANYKAKERRLDAPEFRVIAVCPRLARMLERLKRRPVHPKGFIFLNCHGEPWTSNAIRLAVRRACRKARLDAAGSERVVAYTLRHTAATAATAAGVTDRTLADLMGHSSVRTTARYQHLQVGHLVDAIDRITRRRPA